MTEAARHRTRLAGLALCAGFVVLAGKASYLAFNAPPPSKAAPVVEAAVRADLVDRNGELLATSVTAYSLVANPQLIWDANDIARDLASVLPDVDAAALAEKLSDTTRSFVYVQRGLTPRQRQTVFALGLEGLRFEAEHRRAYPEGAMAGHVLGYTDVDGEGLAGLEYALDDRLREGGPPVRLTLDMGVQASVELELAAAADDQNIKGGAVILMDARTGEVRAMASWPPFDPNRASETKPDDPARLNRAAGAVYELGSIFKPLTVAAAIDSGAVRPGAMFDTSKPIEIAGFKITDDHPIHGEASLARILADSSNIGTVQVNTALGLRRQTDYLERAGLMERAGVDLPGSAAPLVPKQFDALTSATASYGHGLAVSPMAFLSAFSVFANEGERVTPSLVEKPGVKPETTRVMSAVTADLVVTMMREAVTDGTGAPADVAGYRVAGKTGTAEKPIKGGYDATRNVTSFAAVFPSDSPHYALIVTLDEPKTKPGESTAAYTAAPVAGRIIERVAPLLGVAPRFEDVRPEQNVMTVSAPRTDL